MKKMTENDEVTLRCTKVHVYSVSKSIVAKEGFDEWTVLRCPYCGDDATIAENQLKNTKLISAKFLMKKDFAKVKFCPVCSAKNLSHPNDLWEWVCNTCGIWFSLRG